MLQWTGAVRLFAFIFGTLLNLSLLVLIRKKSPSLLREYSRVSGRSVALERAIDCLLAGARCTRMQ